MNTPVELAKNRPAETATPVVMALATLIAKMLGVKDADTVLYMALVLSFVPAAVTWVIVTVRREP